MFISKARKKTQKFTLLKFNTIKILFILFQEQKEIKILKTSAIALKTSDKVLKTSKTLKFGLTFF